MDSRTLPDAVREFAAELFDELYLDLMSFPTAVRKRGLEYAEEGRIGPLTFESSQVWATVHGSTRYVTSWRLEARGWRSRCTCPAGPTCKHAYALGTELLEAFDREESLEPGDLELLFAGRSPRTSGEPAPDPGDASGAAATATFDALLHAADPGMRRVILHRMLRAAGIPLAQGSGVALAEALQQREPDMLGWWLAQEIMRWSGGALPPELERFRDRPDLLRRVAERQRPEIERQLIRWSATRSQRPERQLRLVLALTPAHRGGYRIELEPRLSSPRFRDEPRTIEQLRTMQSQSRSNPSLLSAEHLNLLDALVAAETRVRTSTLSSRESSPRRAPVAELLASLLPTPDARWSERLPGELTARAGVTPGEVVRFDPSPVRLLPRFTPSAVPDEARLELVAAWPDGRQRACTELAVLFSGADRLDDPASFVVSDGVLQPIAEAPPAELLHLMSITPSIPIPRKGSAPLLRALSSALPPNADPLAALTRVHPVETVAMLRLDEDDWLQVRLIAHSPGLPWPLEDGIPESARVFEYTPSGRWEVVTSPATMRTERGESIALPLGDTAAPAAAGAPADGVTDGATDGATGASPGDEGSRAWLHAPDPRPVEPLVEWLRLIDARPTIDAPDRERHRAGRANAGWWIKLNARNVPVLADAWRLRPRHVRWLGNRALLALLGPGRGFMPRIRARSSGVDLLAVSAEWESEGFAISDADLARLRASEQPWVRLSGGWARRDALDPRDQAMDVLADLGVEPGAGEQRVTLWQLAHASPASLEAMERMGVDPETVAAVKDLRRRVATFAGLPPCPVPAGLTGELRPYQRQGLDFLAYNAALGIGAVLADDMGLGKTVQALAWLLHLRELHPDAGPALVVCPASVVHNWEREAQQFAPGLRVRSLTSGAERVRHIGDLSGADLLITNYALLRRDAEHWLAQELFAVIADEAQQIKNPGAAVSRIASELRAAHRLALTGTPLENRALDLWSIVRFVNPGYLGDQRSFTRRFDHPDAPPQARRLLTAKLRPILLRRLKKEVAPELPERIEERRDCEMTPGQRKLYVAELARARTEIAGLEEQGGVRRHKIEILAALTRLRQICCHPRLVGGRENLGSGKFDALFDLLEPLLAEGHKVLLFSQFVRALELVKSEMQERGIAHHLLTGSTTDRAGVVRAFEQDTQPCVFLISLRAGGTGLNLTAASYVVLLDPWWNPAVEAQAIDRTHRIGQDRTVIAYRLLMQGTIEEKIWELQQRKSELTRDVLGEDGFARALDREALDYLFAEV